MGGLPEYKMPEGYVPPSTSILTGRTEKESWIVVGLNYSDRTGRVEDGGALGPFPTESAAFDWADETYGNDIDWIVIPLTMVED